MRWTTIHATNSTLTSGYEKSLLKKYNIISGANTFNEKEALPIIHQAYKRGLDEQGALYLSGTERQAKALIAKGVVLSWLIT